VPRNRSQSRRYSSATRPARTDQRLILGLLRADKIGVTLTAEEQLDPEQSTSAIVVHHPQAKYFSV
jgi:5-methyltetrahydrofolate--homocysteine methyltransferase